MTTLMVPVLGVLPDAMPGHWDSAEGREIAGEYVRRTRESLMHGDKSDLVVANGVFLAGRSDLDLIVWQTAAKERIRWLSAQLAMLSVYTADAPDGAYVAGPIWREADEEGEVWTAEIQSVGGHYVIATVHGGSKVEAETRRIAILAALGSGASA